jgi:threonine dehydratase
MISLRDVRQARERVRSVVVRTPLLAAKFGPENLFFKCENLQRGGAFKIRGAYNSICRLPPARRKRGVVAYSSGNHAQGVALAARILKVPATVVMLNGSIAEKVEQTRAYGADVVLGGNASEEIKAKAEQIASEKGLTLIPPFNHPDTMAGQGTTGLEILEDLKTVKTLVVPIGGGGLISGIAVAVKGSRKGVRIVGVEPEGAPKITRSLHAGHLVTLPATHTIADGLKPVRAGELTFEVIQKLVDEVVTVADGEILAAMAHLIRKEKLMVEPSGAASFAAVQSGKVEIRGPTVCVLSGGNANFELVKTL